MAGRMREQWRSLSCFHEDFQSTEDVARFIKKNAKGKPGSFLLRPSNRNPNLLTASVLVPDGSVRHTHIMIEEAVEGFSYFLVVEKKFDSLTQLLHHYKVNPVRNLENVNNVYLLYPIPNNRVNRVRVNSTQSLERDNVSNNSFTSNMSAPPPLPVRPRTSSSSFSSGSLSSSFNRLPGDPNLERPPCPLPADAGPTYEKCLYSRPRDVAEDISEKLKNALKISERCECGIPRHLAELPLGWTVHQSKEPQTKGKLFYQSPEEKTYWKLPEHVEMQLTRTHITNLKLIDKDWGSKKTPAANGIGKM